MKHACPNCFYDFLSEHKVAHVRLWNDYALLAIQFAMTANAKE
jgi:hypothetical protein